MNIYEYLNKKIDTSKIQDFKGDEYELALLRYILMETSKIFYRSRVFFFNSDKIEQRHRIYSEKINPYNIDSLEIVCSSYCRLLQEILSKNYNLKTELITTDYDVFKHVVLILTTKNKNKYFIDPLMELPEMKGGMKTYNFASKNIKNNPYIKVKLENISFLEEEVLEKIDEKIGYTKNHIYTNNILNDLKEQFDKVKSIENEIEKSKAIENIIKEPVKNLEDITYLKILTFLKNVKSKNKIIGLVDLKIYIKSALSNILNEEEQEKIEIYDFFVDDSNLQDENIAKIIENNETRKRGLIIEYNNKCIICSDTSTEYLTLSKNEWEEKTKNNKIFVRKPIKIILYKHLRELDLEPNILNHRGFLKIFKKIEEKIIKDNKNPEEYIKVINRETININYKNNLEFKIENNVLLLINKNNNKKVVIEVKGEI